LQIVIGDIGAMTVDNVQVSSLHDQLAATGDRASATQVSHVVVRTNDFHLEVRVFAFLFPDFLGN
jgi:hypothetical protein